MKLTNRHKVLQGLKITVIALNIAVLRYEIINKKV